MDKLFVLEYLSPCFIKLGVVRLYVFCVVMQLPESYETNGSCTSNIHENNIYQL